jgi:hypothetical protein
LFSNNGQLFQFGCLRVLPPLYPYFICTSKVLDPADENDQVIIAAYFNKIDCFIKQSSNYYSQFQTLKFVMYLAMVYITNKFFLKKLQNNVNGGLFSILGKNHVEKKLKSFF